MIVVSNRIPVAAGQEAAFEERFRKAHADRPPKEMFAGPNVFEMHEIIHAADGATPLSGLRP